MQQTASNWFASQLMKQLGEGDERADVSLLTPYSTTYLYILVN